MLDVSKTLYPAEEGISPQKRSSIWLCRLLLLVGAVFTLLFAVLHSLTSPEATDPLWARLGITLLLSGLVGLSYWSRRVLLNFVLWARGGLYVVFGWFIVITAVNHFSPDYGMGLLLLYALFTLVAGIGARSIRPVVWFASLGALGTTVALVLSPVSVASQSVLLGSMGLLALEEGITMKQLISTKEQLRDRESRLRGLANSIPGVVFQFYAKPDGTYGTHFVSEGVGEMLGLPHDTDDFYSRFMDHIPSSHREEVLESIDEAVEERKPWHCEMPYDRPSGERAWLLGISVPEKKGPEVVFNGVVLDITKRKEAEQTAQEERNRMVNLFDGLPSPVVHGTFEGDRFSILRVNAAFEHVFGYEASQVKGEDLYDLVVPEGKRQEAIQTDIRALDQGYVQEEVRRLTANGFRDFQVRIARAGRKEPPETYAIYTDVTEQKRREEELQRAKMEAEKASRLKSTMLANMSHEVRTPLTSITGFSEMLKERLNGELKRYARSIHTSSQRLLQTLESVLHLSKLEAGVYDLEGEEVELIETVQDAVALVRQKAKEQSLTIETEWPDVPIRGTWNENAIYRITRNLMENAVKFTPEGGRVKVRVQNTGEDVLLEVKDTGIGISEDVLPHVFEAFRQESEGFGRKYEGNGLGLSIVRRLTEELGGTIDVDTQKGKGTCFTVQLPRPEREEAVRVE